MADAEAEREGPKEGGQTGGLSVYIRAFETRREGMWWRFGRENLFKSD